MNPLKQGLKRTYSKKELMEAMESLSMNPLKQGLKRFQTVLVISPKLGLYP